MSVLRVVKRSVLASKALGAFDLISRSEWRRNRLLILCYHGISVEDEHQVHPGYFLPADIFGRRMEMLHQLDCNVLSLQDGLSRLRTGSLPPRSVVITFDDGWANFYTEAFPILRKYNFPATVYLTTYYCLFNRPIFGPALRYLLWKSRDQVIESKLPWMPGPLHLEMDSNRSALVMRIEEKAREERLSGMQKEELVAEIADLAGFDYSRLVRKRLMNLMNEREVTQMSACGVDIQLHTHRHRTPLDPAKFKAEISENRQIVSDLTSQKDIAHFCYPSGVVHPKFISWLQESDVQSAATSQPDFCDRKAELLLLPRLLDQASISDDEFESWVTGFAAMMPRRAVQFSEAAAE